MVPDPARIDGVRRWDDWLAADLSPHEVLRESSWTPQRNGVSWRVEFRDGGMGRIHVGPLALFLSPDGFARATRRTIEQGMVEELHAADSGIILIADADRMEVQV